jgi:hypothetical protein
MRTGKSSDNVAESGVGSDTDVMTKKLTEKPQVTRVEVIDGNGRSYSDYKVTNCELSYQDDGKTLKVLLAEREKTDKTKIFESLEARLNKYDIGVDIGKSELAQTHLVKIVEK